jgi:hypothetical protein
MKVTKHIEQLLKRGKKPKELTELGFSKSVVTRVSRRLRKEKVALKAKAVKTAQAETQLPTPPESPKTIATIWQKVQSMANDLERIDSLIQALSKASVIIIAAQNLGAYRNEECQFHKDGLCRFWMWKTQDEVPQGIGEPTYVNDEDPGWYVKPTPLYCAMCAASLQDRIADLEDKLSDDPLSGARYQFTCNSCGKRGGIAVKIKCTKCGHETYFGWWPKEE